MELSSVCHYYRLAHSKNLLDFSLLTEAMQIATRNVAWNFRPIVERSSFVFTRAIVDTCIGLSEEIFVKYL